MGLPGLVGMGEVAAAEARVAGTAGMSQADAVSRESGRALEVG